MSATELVVGVDLGTTGAKALARDGAGSTVALVGRPTSWSTVGAGTQTSAEAFVDLTVALLRDLVDAAEAATGPVRVVGVGVSGLAESGVLLDGAGEACAPVVAWFDQRGAAEVDELGVLEPWLPRASVRRTGLPWDCQASIAKLLWLQGKGVRPTAAHRWLSVPELVVHRLGGARVAEPSLASRTGLLDQSTGAPWEAGLAAAGLPASLLPELVHAGTAVGVVEHPGLPAALRGAVLTVAGHDHPVAAIGVGATGGDELVNSSGTADVVARSLPGGLDDDRREQIVDARLSAGAHVLPGTTLLLGGVRGGLVLRRVLETLGAVDRAARDALDRAAVEVGDLPPGLEISGAGPTGDDVVLRLRDDVSPARLWAAATRYTADETAALLATIAAIVGPHRRAVACGGWTRMASVRAAKSAAIDHLEFSDVAEPGVLGAALLAAQAAGVPPAARAASPRPVHDQPVTLSQGASS